MSNAAYFYLIFPAAMLILWMMARGVELPPSVRDTGISREFLKISLFIYKKVRGKMRYSSSERIRMYLNTLDRKKNLDEAETEYFIRKISVVLLMTTAGCFLSMMMCISSSKQGHLQEGGIIVRNEFGEREFETSLIATDESGEELSRYTLPVRTRSFTEKEADELFERSLPELERLVLKDNESFDEVTGDLDLVESIPGYPFDISWKSDNYEVMHFDGSLEEEMIPEGGVIVTLTATYSYEDKKWQQVLYANIHKKELSEAERTFREIKELLTKADEESQKDKEIKLPETYNGSPVIWSEHREDNSILLLFLTLVGAAASYILKDKELKKAMDERSEQMLGDYPQLVSQLVLYMGAGMTMRNIFVKLTGAYAKELKNGGKKKYLYEEMQRAVREMNAGESETAAYEHFGARCGGQQYTRLTTLLSQNLRKGNSELLGLLQEESKKAFDERMDKLRKAGEEAGTKLLLPMIIMLVIVMVIIMIPAYLAF